MGEKESSRGRGIWVIKRQRIPRLEMPVQKRNVNNECCGVLKRRLNMVYYFSNKEENRILFVFLLAFYFLFLRLEFTT